MSTTTLRPSPLVEDCARAIFAHCVTVRRKYHATEERWQRLDEGTREVYRGMAKACIAALRGHTLTFAPLNLRERIRARWKRFVERNWAREYTGPGEL